MKSIVLNVNGERRSLLVDPDDSLVMVLRAQLGLAGTKIGCGAGQCGACSVFVNGAVVRACMTRVSDVPDEADVTTIESVCGLSKSEHPQTRWAKMIWAGMVPTVRSSP